MTGGTRFQTVIQEFQMSEKSKPKPKSGWHKCAEKNWFKSDKKKEEKQK